MPPFCGLVQSKPYKENPEIKAMTDLVRAYQSNDIKDFERILRTNRCEGAGACPRELARGRLSSAGGLGEQTWVATA